MSALTDAKRALRQRSEYHLRLAVLRDLGRGQPSTTDPYRPSGGWGWRWLFVPLYRRIPWSAKERAMHALGMTATGWKPPDRTPGEPWRPPAGVTPPRTPGPPAPPPGG